MVAPKEKWSKPFFFWMQNLYVLLGYQSRAKYHPNQTQDTMIGTPKYS